MKHSENPAAGQAASRKSNLDKWDMLIGTILSDPDLNNAAKVVAVRLALYLNMKTGQLNPGIDTLAKECVMSRRTVLYAVSALEKRGYLQRTRRAFTSNWYKLMLSPKPSTAERRN